MKFQVKYNPYQDLADLAQYQLENIELKETLSDRTGIEFDMQACLISHAFLAEALINMAGFGLYREHFGEGQNYPQKCKKVFTELNVSHIESLDGVLKSLQKARNDLAHAKPKRYDIELKENENEFSVFKRPYDDILSSEFLKRANTVLYELWCVIGDHERIEQYGLITSAVEVT